MDAHVTARLSDYLDDEDLGPDERLRIETHLTACADCREVLDDLREVAMRASALGSASSEPAAAPGDVRPDQNWRQIAARIEVGRPRVAAFPPKRQPRRFSFTMPQLVAASLALMVLSGGTVWLIRHGGERTDFEPISAQGPGAVREAPGLTPPLPVRAGDGAYDAAIADLETALKAGRSRLDPETVRVLEANLRSIDEAIDQSRRALEADPANIYLNIHMADAKKRKLALLRRATALVETRS